MWSQLGHALSDTKLVSNWPDLLMSIGAVLHGDQGRLWGQCDLSFTLSHDAVFLGVEQPQFDC